MVKRFIIESLLFINILISFIGLYDIPPYALYAIIPINFIAIFMQMEMKLKEIYFLTVAIILMSIFFIYAKNTEYIILLSFSVLCTRVNYDKLIRSIWLYMIGLMVLFIVIRYPEYKLYLRGDGTPRLDLGFNNPNILAKYAFGIILITFLYGKRVLAFVLALVFYAISGSRTLLYCILLYPIFICYIRTLPRDRFVFKLPFVLLFPLLTGLSVFLADYSKENPAVDFLLSFRPMHWINYLEAYPISMTGYLWQPLDYYVLDNSFLQLLVRLGLVGTITMSVVYFWIMRALLNQKHWELVFCLVATLIYCVFENMLKYPLFNIATVMSIVYINGFNCKRGTDEA